MNFDEVDAEMLNGGDGIGRNHTAVLDELGEVPTDETLDVPVGSAPASGAGHAHGQCRTAGAESVSMSHYQDCVSDVSLHNAGSANRRCGGRFAPGIAYAGKTDKRACQLLPLPMGG